MLAHIHFKELKIAWITLVMIFLLTRSKKEFDFVIEKIGFFLSTGCRPFISGSELDFSWILEKKIKKIRVYQDVLTLWSEIILWGFLWEHQQHLRLLQKDQHLFLGGPPLPILNINYFFSMINYIKNSWIFLL